MICIIYQIIFGWHEERKTNSMLHNGFIGPYESLNMFRALLWPSSGACDYIQMVSAYGSSPWLWQVAGLVHGCRFWSVRLEGCFTTVKHPSNRFIRSNKTLCSIELVLLSSCHRRCTVKHSSNIRMINSRRMRWAGHTARMGGEERWVHSFSGDTSGKETARNTLV